MKPNKYVGITKFIQINTFCVLSVFILLSKYFKINQQENEKKYIKILAK